MNYQKRMPRSEGIDSKFKSSLPPTYFIPNKELSGFRGPVPPSSCPVLKEVSLNYPQMN